MLLQNRGPDLGVDFVQGCEGPIELRQAAYLLRAIPNYKIFPLIVNFQKMGLRLGPEAEAVLGGHSCSLGQVMVQSAHLFVVDAVEHEKGV